MLGKDYMLAIILVNCDDNLWSDQSLETDPDLPSGWRKIHDSLGTYYWHVPTGTTQWQHPACPTGPRGHLEADGEEMPLEPDRQAPAVMHTTKPRPIPSPMASLTRRTSLPWHGDDSQHSAEPSSKCFAVRSLGWVEIPEEDLAPGKSSIAVNNCIQQLSNSKGQDSVDGWGEGQDLVMILKKDTMSLVDPLDHSLIHCQPILNIRVWGVGCDHGRDFAFVANDKDTCVLKCHVFRCNVPAKGIAKALHTMCSEIVAQRAALCPAPPCARPSEPDPTLRAAAPDAGGRFEALYIGSVPVPRAVGMDVLNAAIEELTARLGRERWIPALLCVRDAAVRVHRAQEEEEDGAALWQCAVRYVTFLGVGRDARTFALIADVGRRFQCAALWCEPDAGAVSEAVQAACAVQYQQCLVAAAPGPKAKRAVARGRRTAAGDAASGSFSATGPKAAGAGAGTRGALSLLEALRRKRALLPLP